MSCVIYYTMYFRSKSPLVKPNIKISMALTLQYIQGKQHNVNWMYRTQNSSNFLLGSSLDIYANYKCFNTQCF